MKKRIDYYLMFSKKTKRTGTYMYEKTICNYLLMFFSKTSSEDFDLKMLNDFILFLKDNTKLSNVSINKCIKMLRCIFNLTSDHLSWLNDYRLLKERKGRFSLLSDSELKLVFNYVDKLNSRGNAEQYRLMIYLLYDTGIRQSELLNINKSDINLAKKCILIKARKSNSDRYVFLSKQMQYRLKDYLKTCNNKELLFYNRLRDRVFTRNDLKLFYRRLKRATGIKRIHSHMFRHTYATDLIELNVPLFVIQKQLGHASIKTTEIYYHSSIKFQKEEMMKISSIR